jgi:hypothetical protein
MLMLCISTAGDAAQETYRKAHSNCSLMISRFVIHFSNKQTQHRVICFLQKYRTFKTTIDKMLPRMTAAARKKKKSPIFRPGLNEVRQTVKMAYSSTGAVSMITSCAGRPRIVAVGACMHACTRLASQARQSNKRQKTNRGPRLTAMLLFGQKNKWLGLEADQPATVLAGFQGLPSKKNETLVRSVTLLGTAMLGSNEACAAPVGHSGSKRLCRTSIRA